MTIQIINSPRRLHLSRFIALFLGLIVAGFWASAQASTVLRLDLESLVANSDQIVEAEVLKVEPRVENGKVYTYTTMRVEDGLKGAEDGETVTIKQIGGRTEELATRVAGVPQFKLGERVVVFLERPDMDKFSVVTGMSQGKFQVALGPDNLTPYVVPFLGDINLLEPAKPTLRQRPSELKLKEIKQVDPTKLDKRKAPISAHPIEPRSKREQAVELSKGNLRAADPAALYQRVTPLDDFKAKVREVIQDQAPEKD